MTRLEIVSAHLIVQFCMMAIQTVLLIVVMYVVYDNPLQGDLNLSLSLLSLVAILGIAFGKFICSNFIII